MFFGKQKYTVGADSLLLNNNPIEIVNKWKYLGFTVTSGKNVFSFDSSVELTSFYRSSNCLINALYKPSEEVLMRLFYSNCVSIFAYGAEIKDYLAKDMSKINVAINDGIRKIFGWHRWESVRHLRQLFGYSDIYSIFAIRARNFNAMLRTVPNKVLNYLFSFLTK